MNARRSITTKLAVDPEVSDSEGLAALIGCMDDRLLSEEWARLVDLPEMSRSQRHFFRKLHDAAAFRLWKLSTAPKEGSC
jgi:hypothetical protein